LLDSREIVVVVEANGGRAIDLIHKGVFALVSGYLCDKYVRGVEWFNV